MFHAYTLKAERPICKPCGLNSANNANPSRVPNGRRRKKTNARCPWLMATVDNTPHETHTSHKKVARQHLHNASAQGSIRQKRCCHSLTPQKPLLRDAMCLVCACRLELQTETRKLAIAGRLAAGEGASWKPATRAFCGCLSNKKQRRHPFAICACHPQLASPVARATPPPNVATLFETMRSAPGLETHELNVDLRGHLRCLAHCKRPSSHCSRGFGEILRHSAFPLVPVAKSHELRVHKPTSHTSLTHDA